MCFAEAGFPFTPKEIRELAFEYSQAIGVKGFSLNFNEGGQKWFHNFLQRYPDLEIRSPKLLAIYRAECANKRVIDGWFQIYHKICMDNSIKKATHIWNIDECGCIDQPKPKKVVCAAGVRSNQVAAGDQGETSTAVVYANAAGLHIHPLIIHKGGKVMEAWRKGMIRGTVIGASENGWITKKLFYYYGQIFIERLKKYKLLDGTKHLLLLDSHKTHLFNYHCLSNGIR